MPDQSSFLPADASARIPIAELQSGQTIDTYFTCSEKTAANDRNGKAYLRLKLRDATGEVAAIHFDPSDEALNIAAGDVVMVGGTYSVHPQYGPQVQIRRLRPAGPEEFDAGLLVQVSPIGAAELGERLHALIDSVDEPHLRALLERAFDGTQEPGATFVVAPAAVRNHHAYRHGLIEHSLIVAATAADVSSRFAAVDRDLVVAVDRGEPRGDVGCRRGDDERVLDQAVAVGMVVAHRGRGHDEGGAWLLRAVEGAFEQRAQVRLVHRVDECVQSLAQLRGADGRYLHEQPGVEFLGPGGA